MVLLSFSVAKENVRKGIKGMSMRLLRKRPFRVGDRLDLYWKCRTKECELLRRDPCLYERRVTLAEILTLPEEKRELLAKLDGFTDWQEMYAWFMKTHAPKAWTIFQIVCWIPNVAIMLKIVFEQNEKGEWVSHNSEDWMDWAAFANLSWGEKKKIAEAAKAVGHKVEIFERGKN